MAIDAVVLERFDIVIGKADEIIAKKKTRAQFPDTAEPLLLGAWRPQCQTLLRSVLGNGHPYVDGFDDFQKNDYISSVQLAKGVLISAREDYAKGYLWNLKEIVHADVFDDYLAMAEYLVNDGGFKDAAAVIAGSTLEAHLRQLCAKNGVAVQVQGKNRLEPKKASAMNEELRLGSVYSQAEGRQVQAWLDLRNDAAHGDYAKFTQQQVELMIQGIAGFFIRYPA